MAALSTSFRPMSLIACITACAVSERFPSCSFILVDGTGASSETIPCTSLIQALDSAFVSDRICQFVCQGVGLFVFTSPLGPYG